MEEIFKLMHARSLKGAIEHFASKVQTDDLAVVVEVEDLQARLDKDIQTVAWFLTVEALRNAKKHAQANHIWVRMYMQDADFITEIEDDGVGFDIEAVKAAYKQLHGTTASEFKAHLNRVNGTVNIKSVPGKGTKVVLTVPVA